ncbi:MAG: hypothetical protein JSV09_09850 [Thermoplasmata archaeon]|nr:MAG: hypothetical protein JSV09_09850 [Thermoplasmata archaeon]
MKKAHFLLIGMLFFSCIAVNLTSSITADESHGTRNPGADVTLTAITENQTAKPTDSVSYIFVVNNTGDQNDSYTVSAISQHSWLVNWSNYIVGPLKANESTRITVNMTIPMGVPADTVDNLTFTVQSESDVGVIEQVILNTTIIEAFVVEIDIEDGYQKTSSIDPPNPTNYTLTIRNKGNDNVTITIKHSTPKLGWVVSSPYQNFQISVDEANQVNMGIESFNITIEAPEGATPGDEMTITIWGEKQDEGWFSWQYQENITITTIVQSNLGVGFLPESYFGYVGSRETIYNFTMWNSGNKDINARFDVYKDQLLTTELDFSEVRLRVGELPIRNRLKVTTARNAALGNYSINITAVDVENDTKIIGAMELYYIIVPVLNITDISISDKEPMQYRPTDVIVTIENIGPVDATNITVKLYDGKNKVVEKELDPINASKTATVKISWSPSDFGNRTLRVLIDVEGEGDFSEHGTNLAEDIRLLEVKINWQPYYLAIYIIIAVVLGIGTIAGMLELRYYGGRPLATEYGEGEEELPYDEFPEEGEFPEEYERKDERPFATTGITTGLEERMEERPLYERPRERPEERPMGFPPEMRREPYEKEIMPPKDPETERKENELKDEIARVQGKLDKTKSLGVDTTNISQLLRTAKRSLSDGDHHKSKQYIGYANERLDNLMSKRDEALKAIKEAKEILSQMRGTADLTIVENFLVKADSLLQEGNFREAISYANKAKERAVRLQRREMRL